MPSWVKKVLWGFAILILLVVGLISLLQTGFVKAKIARYVETYLRENYRVNANIRNLTYRLSPPLLIHADGVKVYGGHDNAATFLTAGYLEAVIPYSSLWSDNFIVDRITLNTPSVWVENLPKVQSKNKSENNGTFQINQIEITGGVLRYARMRVRDMKMNAVVLKDSVELQGLTARLEDLTLHAKGTLKNFDNPVYDGTYRVDGDAKAISAVFPQAPPLNGSMATEGKVHGGIGFYTVQGDLKASSLSVNAEPGFAANAIYNVDSRDKRAPYNLSLTWKDLPLSIARKFAPDIPRIASKSNGSAHYAGTEDFWHGTGDFETSLISNRSPGMPMEGRIQGSISGGAVRLSPSALALNGARVEFSGSATEDTASMKVRASVPNVSRFSAFVPALKRIPGSYVVDSTISGPFSNLEVNWNLKGTDPDFSLSSTGTMYTGTKRFNAQLNGQMDATAIDRFYPAKASGQIFIDAAASGTPSNPVLHAIINGKDMSARGTKLGDLNIKADSDGRVLTASADIPRFNTSASAGYRLNSKNYQLQMQFDRLALDQLRPFLPASTKDMSGTLSGRLDASGNAERWRNSVAQLTLNEANLEKQGKSIRIEPGSLLTLQNQIATVNMKVTMPEGQLNVAGTVPLNPRRDINLHAAGNSNLSLVSMFTDAVTVQGPISLNVNVSGKLRNPVVTGTIESNQFTATVPERKIEITQGTMRANLQGDHAEILTTASVNGSPFRIEGTVPMNTTGQMAVRVTGQPDLKLLNLVTDQVQGNGVVSIDVQLNGPVTHPNYAGSVRSDNFAVLMPSKDINFTQGKMEADFSGSRVSLQTSGSLNGSALQVHGTIPLANIPGELHVSLSSFPIATIARESGLSGAITVALDATGQGIKPTGWSGLLTVTPQDLRVESTPITMEQPLRVQLTSGMAQLYPVHISATELLDVEAQAKVNFKNGGIDARLRSSAELALVSRFVSGAQASGALVANVNVGGTMNDPRLNGIVRLSNGVFRIPQSPILLEKIQLVAPLETDRITIESLSAQMGGGTIRGGGELLLTRFTPSSVNLWAKADRIGMRYPGDLRTQINADVTMKDAVDGYLLAGKVQVARSIFRDDIDPAARLVNTLLRERQNLSPPSASESILHLDLSVETVEDFQMRNNLGKVQAAADLQVTGTLSQPRISGRLRIREGSIITFMNREFEIRRGTMDFYGRAKPDPVFDVEVFTTVADVETGQDYEITMPFSGPMSNLDKRDPTSYPPLNPNQIYFLLLTGRTGSQLSDASAQFVQQQMAAYVSGQLFSDFTKQFANLFGLQRVEIQPEVVSTETDPSAKLVLGKDFTNALSLIYTISLTDSSEQTWLARYRARRNLTFRFIDQDDGTYTSNIRHLIRFGPGVSARSLRSGRTPTIRRIASIKIDNNSPLPETEIRKMIKLDTGDEYDFWKIQDGLDKIEQKLQKQGYLFPRAEMEESQASRNAFNIVVSVNSRQKRSVIFRGYRVTKHQKEKYDRFWREGFSEEGVLEMIREDLLRGMWFDGYQKAAVRRDTSSANGLVQHLFTMTPGPLFTKVQYVIHGAKQYEADELEEDLRALYPDSREMNADAIHNFKSMKDKLIALYVQKGYLDAEVTSNDTRYQANIAEKIINVDEGPQSRINEVLISDGLTFPPDLQKKLLLHEGALYLPQNLDQDELTIGDYYEKLGYRKFKMKSEIRKMADGGIVVEYRINPGGIAHVNAVEITGDRYTDRSLIEKRVDLKTGEILNHEKLASAQKSLTDLRIFHSVSVTAEETDVPNEYNVLVNVVEIKRYELTYGLRYDTEKGIGGEGQLTNLNLFGTGQSISVYSRLNQDNQLYQITYHSPTRAGLKWKTLVSTSYETGDLFLRQANEFGLAEGQRFNATFQRQHQIWRPFILVYNYQFERLRTRPAISPADFPFDSFKISLLGSQIFADTRDDPINTKRGRFISFDFQWAPSFLISDVNYVRSYSQYLNFQPMGKYLWASAIRLGLASHLGPRLITERFLAGGSYSIRGFERDAVGPKDPFGNPIGGEAVFIINEEMRVPIFKWISGVAFYDAGNVYNGFTDFNPLRLRHSVGAGLRFDSPLGIVRGDVGINLFRRDDEPRYVLHFGIGQAF